MNANTPIARCESHGHHQFSELESLCEQLRNLPELEAKQAIRVAAKVHSQWNTETSAPLSLEELYAQPGDDCAAFRSGDGYQLLAMEAMSPAFVANDARAAGWSSVMVNVSDIAAMGGRATAIVNAFWDNNTEHAEELLYHIRRACDVFGVRFSGGHSSIAPQFTPGLAVGILGQARGHLLSSHHVKPGQRLFLLTDLEGSWHGNLPYWGCVLGKSPEQIRSQWHVPAMLAERGLVAAAKDVSNGGILGTLLMLLELTGCGATVDLNAIPKPDADLLRWMRAFQSFGFLLTVEPNHISALLKTFEHSHLSCAPIGSINDSGKIMLDQSGATSEFWDLTHHNLTAMEDIYACRTF